MLFSAIGKYSIPHIYTHIHLHICICVCVRPTKNKPHLQRIEIFQLSHTLTHKLMQLIWNRDSGVGSIGNRILIWLPRRCLYLFDLIYFARGHMLHVPVPQISCQVLRFMINTARCSCPPPPFCCCTWLWQLQYRLPGCTRCRTVVSAVDDNWRLGQLDHKRGLRIVVNPLAGTSSAIARFVCFTRVFKV